MRVLGFFLLCLLPAFGFSRPIKAPASPLEGRIAYYVGLYSQVGGQLQSSDDLAAFVEKLERKQTNFKQTSDFLEHIFNKTHQKFLRNFSEYAAFPEMLNSGNYNCLTGTVLYALILDHFDIRYKIIETNYHIFLLAQTDEGPILFETTDPVSGFVTNSAEIEKRISSYKKNSLQSSSSKTYYRYNFDLYNSVNLDQIQGLLHYNISIVAFNAKDIRRAIDELGKAMEFYQSPRFDEFSRVILLTIMESDLDPSEKEGCLDSIRALRDKNVIVTASSN